MENESVQIIADVGKAVEVEEGTEAPRAEPRVDEVPRVEVRGAAEGCSGDRLWTVRETAAYLGKSARWLFDVLRTPESEPGSIPFVRIGRSPRFIPDDIRAWLDMQCPPVILFRKWREKGRR